jgi:hypothetical protein
MEHETATTVIAKVGFAKEPKWTMVMAKNVHQVVSQAMKTLANAPKQEKHKFNPRLTGLNISSTHASQASRPRMARPRRS